MRTGRPHNDTAQRICRTALDSPYLSHREIAERCNITRARVSQVLCEYKIKTRVMHAAGLHVFIGLSPEYYEFLLSQAIALQSTPDDYARALLNDAIAEAMED